jgi:hypothetical protein
MGPALIVGHVESSFGPFGDSVSAGAREVHGLRQMNHKLRKPFWTHSIELLGDVGYVESHFGPFGDSVNIGVREVPSLRQTTIATEIILDAPDGTPR